MINNNPPSKSIDISAQEGLDLLKSRAQYYGHYAEQLKVLELIKIVEDLRADVNDLHGMLNELQE